METAVATFGQALNAENGPHNLARSWLFPREEDLDSAYSIYAVDQDFQDKDWIDKGLNPEQRVSMALLLLILLMIAITSVGGFIYCLAPIPGSIFD